MNKVLTVFTDGGSRGNPGPAAAGVYITLDGQDQFKGGKFLGATTNNIAEYNAVVLALNWILKNASQSDFTEIVFTLDSELIVKQLKGEYKVKDKKLQELYAICQSKLTQLSASYTFKHVRREYNTVADSLVNSVLDNL